MRPAAALFLAFALGLAACEDTAGPEGVLALNRERWREQGLDDYEFMFTRYCFCLVEAAGPVQIRVAAGTVVSVIDTLGQPVDSLAVAQYFTFTIDSLFGVVEHAIAVHAHRLDVRYHPSFGYPEFIFIDYDAQTIDEETTLIAALLVPFSPQARLRVAAPGQPAPFSAR
jgi:hypothetical protein